MKFKAFFILIFFILLTVILPSYAQLSANKNEYIDAFVESDYSVFENESSKENEESLVSDDIDSISDNESREVSDTSDDNEGDISESTISQSEDSSNDEPVKNESDYIFEYYGEFKNVEEKSFEKLEKIINDYKDRISIYYKSLDTGVIIDYKSAKDYFSASVIKAPYVKYILSTNPDLSEKIIIGKSVSDKPAGSVMTVNELIYFTLVNSGNNSYTELTKRFGPDGFNKMSKSIGVTCTISSNRNYCNMTAEEAGKYFVDIYNYIQTGENGKHLYDLMTSCVYKRQIEDALKDKHKVAHKYGYFTEKPKNVFHNAAIVFADNHYVLCIYSDMTQYEYKIFQQIALAIDEINAQIQVNE